MPTRARSIVLCLLAVLLTNVALYFLSQRSLERGLQQLMHEHLASSLAESLFGDDKERVNDSVSIAYIGRQINKEAAGWVKPKWYAAIEPTAVAIATIDGVAINGREVVAAGRSSVTIDLRRNARTRAVALYYEHTIRWPVFILLGVAVAALFTAIIRCLPTPLTAEQIRWTRRLVNDNYHPDSAQSLVASLTDDQLNLSVRQRQIFDLVHAPTQHNFAAAHRAAQDARVASLTALDVEWFALSFAATGDLSVAWQMATREECVSIDLANAALSIRGRSVHVAKTPLFYYAWYALKRIHGAGWMLNPPSNRPDRDQGRELAELMWKCNGHAKAISELEQHGLRAKTLDQNRSKLREELVAALGPTLAEHYLFDTEKDALGRLRYRLKPTAAQIKMVESKTLGTELKPQRA